MNQNPYATALFSIGAIGMIIAILCFVGGGASVVDGLGLLSFAGALFPVAGFSLVGWLLLEGSRWNPPVVRPSPTEPRKQ